MTSKKDLEIIYNLQWKNKPANGGDKASIIGVYDIPATTLNYEVFKSYLLKNSGTTGDDVKVSYVTDNGKEYPIQSQTDFQVALYAFRRKARLGEMITLKLDRISDQPHYKNTRHSNDVETQFDEFDAPSLNSTCCGTETPPEWFINFMAQFKKDFTEEITATVSSIVSSAVSNMKPQVVSQPACYHSRKGKEPSKRHRKLQPLLGESPSEGCRSKERTKDIMKSLKLDTKLEKLERKATKYKEKKLALFTVKSSDSEAGQSSGKNKSQGEQEPEDAGHMDATPVTTQSIIPHMVGGEVYLHQWEVMNTGTLPWTSKTFLQHTWGSKSLQPLDKVITVPYLTPGERGTVAVRLQIPDKPGLYESYWHFVHKGRRFGHWLGCQIIVDPFDLKGNKSVLETTAMFASTPTKVQIAEGNKDERDTSKVVTHYSRLMMADPLNIDFGHDGNDMCLQYHYEKASSSQKEPEAETDDLLRDMVNDVNAKVDDMHLQDPTDTNCSSDSDNQSVASLSVSSNSSKCSKEFVVVPVPDCFTFEKQNEAENEKLTEALLQPSTSSGAASVGGESCDDNNNTENSRNCASGGKVEEGEGDMVFITVPKEKENDEGFAYVLVDGQRVQIPKSILKSEFLEQAEKAQKMAERNASRSSSNASSVELIAREEIPASKQENMLNLEQDCLASGSTVDANNDLSHCSAVGSCFSEVNGPERTSRLFIFPQNCPGFEVVSPCQDQQSTSAPKENIWVLKPTNVATTAAPSDTAAATTSAHPNYTPPLNLSTHDRNPFSAGINQQTTELPHVPNYQQTPPEHRQSPPVSGVNIPTQQDVRPSAEALAGGAQGDRRAPHILPETLVTGAVNVASSAINTARSVINMIASPREPGRWENGHWVSTNPETPREANLQALAEMGFWNRDLNATLLARYKDDLNRVVAELVQ